MNTPNNNHYQNGDISEKTTNAITTSNTKEIPSTQKGGKSLALLFSLLVVIAFGTGFVSGQWHTVEASKIQTFILGKNKVVTEQKQGTEFNMFWDVANVLDQKFIPTKKNASSTTPLTAEEKSQRRMYGAIKGMVATEGDPYTTFFTPEEMKEFEIQIEGTLEGVGMLVDTDPKTSLLTAVTVYKNTPAERAGIHNGDKILQIDDVDTTNMTPDKAVKLIRGKKGTQVRLKLYREGVDKPFTVIATRDVVRVPTIESKLDTQTNVYTIKIYSFNGQVTELFKNSMNDFLKSGSNKLVIDLRGNGGGYLDAAVDIASWFLPEGSIIVREDQGKGMQELVMRSKGYKGPQSHIKTAILVDGGTASASEILAGALRENDKATVIGTQTFGKGSVQELVRLDNGAALKVTVARWLTPKGMSISEGGITPDIVIINEKASKSDAQMQKAIELLSK
jgi:carboxyl-terminal processing protease